MLDFTRKYLMQGLAGTPDVLTRLLAGVRPGDPRWDVRPDPARWTLREITAHLADWEGIFVERIGKILGEDNPGFGHVDVTQRGLDQKYQLSDPSLNLSVFRERRSDLLATLAELSDEEWLRTCQRHIGPMPLEEMAALILGHDGYHLHQVVEWLDG